LKYKISHSIHRNKLKLRDSFQQKITEFVTSHFLSFYTIKQNILNFNNSEADNDVGQ